MVKKPKTDTQNGPSLANLADTSLREIARYAISDNDGDKLIGFNVTLTFLILTLLIAGFLLNSISDMVVTIAYLFVSGIFAAILSYCYLRIVEIIANLISKNYIALKISVTFLFFIVSISLIGFLYHIKEVLNLAFALLIIQLLVLIGLGFVRIPDCIPTDQNVGQGTDYWTTIGRIADIFQIINFIFWIGVIMGKTMGWNIPFFT